MDARCPVSPPARRMNRSDSLKENDIFLCPSRWTSHPPRVVPAGRDFQQTAHRGDRVAIVHSRTRRPWWYRAGLPSEPGRGFCQDLPLQTELTDLTVQLTQFVSLFGAQPGSCSPFISVCLMNPGVYRLVGRLELLRQFTRCSSCPHKIDYLPSKFLWIRRSCTRHRSPREIRSTSCISWGKLLLA